MSNERGGDRQLGRGALALIALLVVLLTLVQAATFRWDGPAGLLLLLFTADTLVFTAAGVIALYRRPRNAFGFLLICAGLTVWVAGFGNAEIPALQVAGGLLGTLPLAAVVHLLHAFPTGALRGRLSVATVATGYVASVPLQVLVLATADAAREAWAAVQDTLGLAAMIATAVLLGYRLWASPAAKRWVLAPLYGYGLIAVVFLPVAVRVLGPLGILSDLAIGCAQIIALGLVPIAFTIAAAIGGFTPTAAPERLAAMLGAAGREQLGLAQLLGRALDDPSLETWFWIPEREGYVAADGESIGPETHRGRALHVVTLDGRRVGAIVYDKNAIADAEVVAHAAGIAAIALDRERLLADLRLSRTELQRSRERLVSAADGERTRIARDLHDGLQVQLVLLALEAQQLARAEPALTAQATALRRGIDDAAAQLRRTVHDVMPAALVERGLSSAAEDLVDRMPIPTAFHLAVADGAASAAVETTVYFVLAEALANIVKHAGATRAEVRIVREGSMLRLTIADDGRGGATSGGGLRGITDRVDVLGGSVIIDSPVNGGTLLRVEVPCGS